MAQPNEVNNLNGIDLVQLREWQDSGKSIHCQNKQTKNKKELVLQVEMTTLISYSETPYKLLNLSHMSQS